MSMMLVLLASAMVRHTTSYTLTDLGANYYAYGINNNATPTIVGKYQTGTVPTGCYWYNGATSATTVSPTFIFVSVNDSNIAVGTDDISATSPYDFVCTYDIVHTTITTYPTPGSSPAFGWGINNNGWITGFDAGAQRDFVIGGDGAGVYEYLYAPNASNIQTGPIGNGPYDDSQMGNSINTNGSTDAYVTGFVSNSDPFPPKNNGFFVQNRSANDALSPKEYAVVSSPLNGSGTGTAIDSVNNCASNRGSNAYFYNFSAATFTLIGLSTDTTTASGISYVDVAGTYEDQVVGSHNGHAYVWTVGGGIVDLNSVTSNLPVGWTLTVARAVNNSGCIVGYGTNGTGTVHAFLLTP